MFLDLDKKDRAAVAVIDDSGAQLTYGEICDFSAEFAARLPVRSLIFLLAENRIGSLLGYTACLSERIVPLILSAKTETGLYERLCDLYRPAYLWAPEEMEFPYEPVFRAWGYVLLKTGFDSATGTLTLDFVDANMIEAGHAYIVKWTSGDNISNPVFNGVTVVNENPDDQKVVSQDGYVQFIGTYSPVNIYTAAKTNLYLGADNTLYYPWGDAMNSFYINSCRAYFQLLNGLTAGDPGNGVRAINLNFGEGSEETIISPAKIAERADAWYTIDGVKLNGKPNVKGLYINNGRKVVIK